jgi:hypothetical protein
VISPNILPIVDYTTDERTDGRLKDPVNLVFVGSLAQPDRVYEILIDPLGLVHDKGVSDQYFSEPANPVVSHRQDYNQSNHYISGWWSRMHARVYSAFTAHPVYGPFTVAAIHRDHWVSCPPFRNDAAESYDAARKWATDLLRQRYDVAVILLRAVSPIRQCNGDETATDGMCAVVGDRGTLAALGLPVLTADER